MSAAFPELEAARVEVSTATRERHLSAIATALSLERRPRGRRLRLMAIAIAIVLLVPVIALAAERTGPGDFLYPVRQVIGGLSELVDVLPAETVPSTAAPEVGERGVTGATQTDRILGTSPNTTSDERLRDADSGPTRSTGDRGEAPAGSTDVIGERVTGGSTAPQRDQSSDAIAGTDGRSLPGPDAR